MDHFDPQLFAVLTSPRASFPPWFHLNALRVAAALAAFVSPLIPEFVSAQQPGTRPALPRDSAERVDSAIVKLAPVEVRASIAPVAGSGIGSGVPARISIVTTQQIDAWTPRLLPELLASQPGVSVYDDLGTPWKLNLALRGFTVGPTVGLPPGLTVFLDGVRQNEPAAQEVNFDLLPLDHVTHVEMLSGSASLLGPNSLGGAINLVTARGDGPPSGKLQASGGSFGQASAEASLGARGPGGTDYFVGVGYGRERGWRDATGAKAYNGFANVGRASAHRGLRLQVYGAHSRAETAGSLPESLFRGAPRTNFTAGDFEDLSAKQAMLSGYTASGGGRAGLIAHVRHSNAERFNVNQAPDPNVRARTSNLTAGATADWLREFASERRGTFAVRVGVDGAANRVRARIYAEPVGPQEPPSAHDSTIRGLTTDIESPSIDVGTFVLVDYTAGRVTLSGGGRYDFVRVPFQNQIRTTDNTVNDYWNLSPRVGASLKLGQGSSLYASAGRSFRAPAILELGCADPEAACPLPFALGDDPPLEPVRATTYEVGGRWSTGGSRGAVISTVSAYRTDVRDEIFFVASEQALFAGYFTNLDRTRREGLELGIQGTSWARLTWYGSYSWTRATFQSAAALFSVRGDDDFAGSSLAGDNDVQPGSRLPLVPDHQVKLGGLLHAGRGVSLGVDFRYTGEQWLRGDEANVTSPLDAYSITNVRIGYVRSGWEVAGKVTNALGTSRASFGTFNENRQTGELERFLTPINGRAVTLVVSRFLGSARDQD